MDAQLGKQASISVRRLRIHERQKQKELMAQQREERQKRMMRYNEIYNIDSASASDNSRSNSPEHDCAVDTPSDCSISTPDNSFSPDVDIRVNPLDLGVRQLEKKKNNTSSASVRIAAAVDNMALDRRRSKSKAKQPAMFGASLNNLCDFRYDRFSTVFETIDLPIGDEEEDSSEDDEENDKNERDTERKGADETESSASDSEDENDDEDYSPIEVATPIAIRMPVSKPAMISVVSFNGQEQGPQKFSVKNINNIMVNNSKASTPQHEKNEFISDSRPQTSNSCLISEVKSLGATTPSSASIVSVAPSTARSLPPLERTPTDNNLKKKSSMPMLQKFTHSRMHSIKNFIKPQSISGPPPAVPMIPSAHQTRPSESANQILLSVQTPPKPSALNPPEPRDPRRSFTEPSAPNTAQPQIRPQTARAPSIVSITALPPPLPSPTPSSIMSTPIEEVDQPNMNRKKSFSNLRRRSGSLGQALKFSSSKSKSPVPDAPLPPLPTIKLPARDSLAPAATLPTPPKTPRTARKSGLHMYSAFPPPPQAGQPIGLGLRMES